MGIAERFAGSFGFHEEFGLASDAEVIVRAARRLAFAAFDDHLALVMRKSRFVFHVPAQGFEEGRDEINAGLGFAVGARKVMRAVGVKFADEY